MKKIKFEDVRFRFDNNSREFYLTIYEGYNKLSKIAHETVIRDGRTIGYHVTACSAGVWYDYISQEDKDRWSIFSRHSVVEKLMGHEVSDEDEFTLENLKNIEFFINMERKNAFEDIFVAAEDGKDDFSIIKKGDLLLRRENREDINSQVYIEEIDGKYALICSNEGIILLSASEPLKAFQRTDKLKLPKLNYVPVSGNLNNQYVVFPNYSHYMDAAEYGKFTKNAYKNFAELKKQRELKNQGQGPSSND